MLDLEPRTRQFPSAPESMKAVRAFVEEAVCGHPRLDDVVLVADELATNAFQHTGATHFSVTLCPEEDDGITVLVANVAVTATEPHVCGNGVTGSAGGEHGRGMFIVENMCSEWGVKEGEGEQVVYASLDAPTSCVVA